MSNEWDKVGSSEGLSVLIPGPTHEVVRNHDTGEAREIYKGSSQTTGEAIKNGQFTDRDVSNMNKK